FVLSNAHTVYSFDDFQPAKLILPPFKYVYLDISVFLFIAVFTPEGDVNIMSLPFAPCSDLGSNLAFTIFLFRTTGIIPRSSILDKSKLVTPIYTTPKLTYFIHRYNIQKLVLFAYYLIYFV